MNLIADYTKRVTTDENEIEITFKVDRRYMVSLSSLTKKEYALTIKEVHNDRSTRQNALLWAILEEIAKAQDGHRADKHDIYIQLLKKSHAKTIEIACIAEALEEVVKLSGYRAHRVLSTYVQNGKLMYYIEAFIGSSKMDTKEMGILIDNALDWAEELGISTDNYNNLLKEVEKCTRK